ncbi:MAG TPA: hypothetical protein VGB85_07750, partial [Nannocystis sp.]
MLIRSANIVGPMSYSTTTLPSLRWLLAVPLTSSPSGRVVPLADVFEHMPIAPELDLGPAVGADGPRRVVVQFPRLRSFSRAAVLAAAPLLASLQALAQRLAADPGTAPADVLASVAGLVGEGPLHAELAAIFAGKPQVTAEPAAAAPVGDTRSLVDELLDRATTSATAVDRPASIIDAIVRSGRPRPDAHTKTAAQAARERILAAADRGADAALADPRV